MHSITKARIALSVALAILMLAAGLELASISSMVYWLHYRAGKDFTIAYQDSTFSLHGKPENLLVDQGHTSNGAAGTAFVLVSLLGFVALAQLQKRTGALPGQRATGARGATSRTSPAAPPRARCKPAPE